jgi:putative Holliday junction resolvase
LIASPIPAIEAGNAEHALQQLVLEAQRHAVDGLLVGLPLRLDGSEGESARSARALAERLRAATGLQVTLWDERLTTRAAERALSEAGARGVRRRKAVDSVAAALLLQSFLDAERERDGRTT